MILTKQSDYSRAQYTEKYIQDRVAAELKKLEKQTVKNFQAVTDNSLAKDNEPGLSVGASNEKLQKLTKLLEENAKLAKVEVSKDVQDARGEVIKCLKDNQGKSLNCWDEVEAFSKVIKEL